MQKAPTTIQGREKFNGPNPSSRGSNSKVRTSGLSFRYRQHAVPPHRIP
jgi:hypothetical protein